MRCAILRTLLLGITLLPGCRGADHSGQTPMNRRPIEQVLQAHTTELMAEPGVVGVYQGALADGSPCIGVMVVKKSAELEKKIPRTLEGYPVRIDETGEIRPR
jgi:hypothetical protein